jgi:hypothetical protein
MLFLITVHIAILFLLPAAKGLIAVRPFVSVGKALAPLSQPSSVSNSNRRPAHFPLRAFFNRNGNAEVLQAINATNAKMKQGFDAQAKSNVDLHGAIGTVSEKVESLQEDFVALETTVNEVKNDVGAMQNKFGEVENKLTGSILDLRKEFYDFYKNWYVGPVLTFFAALIGVVVGTKSN